MAASIEVRARAEGDSWSAESLAPRPEGALPPPGEGEPRGAAPVRPGPLGRRADRPSSASSSQSATSDARIPSRDSSSFTLGASLLSTVEASSELSSPP